MPAASCGAVPPPPSSASTTPSRPTATSPPATMHVLLVLDEGDHATRRRHDGGRRRGVRDRRPPRRRPSSSSWLGHRNDVSALEKLIARWPRRRHHGGGRRRGRALDASLDAAIAAIGAVEGVLAVSAHQSHAYPDGACLYFTFAGQPTADRKRRVLRRGPRDAGTRAVLDRGGALSHHHGIGMNRSRFVPDGARRRLRRVGRDEGRPRSERHPQSGQARSTEPLRRGVVALSAPATTSASDPEDR
ncbi:MAG: FAD-linked oxidase C-terminal domain-containing protein [Acidimicrobiia bacterium]|nr:FAD-linked oxidase C-terminal domain-containing protein [Acidimicrobiia bacterium]